MLIISCNKGVWCAVPFINYKSGSDGLEAREGVSVVLR